MNKKSASVAEIPVGGGKQNRALVIDNIVRHMMRGSVYPAAPFPKKFVVSCPQRGNYLIYEQVNDQKVVEPTNMADVTNTIIKWAQENWLDYPELLIDPMTAKDAAKMWLGAVDHIQGVIKSFEFADGKDYVTHRVPFVPDLTADFSHVDITAQEWKDQYPFIEFLSRCSSPDQVAAFIGSIFYPESYRQQYLNIWGEGNDGKGSVVRALEKILAGAFHSDSFEFMGRFWTSAFIGKRLIVFPDNNDQKAMQSGMWKQLTGGDSVRVEIKREATFTAKLNAKFIITSNFAPVLKMDRADQRRAIVVRVAEIAGDIDPKIERVMAEDNQLKFLVEYSCWKYRSMCGDHQPIPIQDSQVDLIQNADDEIEQKILTMFSFSPTLVTPIHTIREVLGSDFNHVKVPRILKQRFGCLDFQARTEGGGRGAVKHRYYVGIGVGSWDMQKQNERNYNAVKNLKKYQDTVAQLPPVTQSDL